MKTLWLIGFMISTFSAAYGLIFIELSFFEKISGKTSTYIIADVVAWLVVFLFLRFTKWSDKQ